MNRSYAVNGLNQHISAGGAETLRRVAPVAVMARGF
jgi:hypothetical protein